jgi:hypothetical protein
MASTSSVIAFPHVAVVPGPVSLPGALIVCTLIGPDSASAFATIFPGISALSTPIREVICYFKFYRSKFCSSLFEMWRVSRHSKKIRKELQSCIAKVVAAIKKKLEDELDAQQSDVMAKALLALADGIAFHILINPPEDLKDKKFWLAIRNMMLGVLKQ